MLLSKSFTPKNRLQTPCSDNRRLSFQPPVSLSIRVLNPSRSSSSSLKIQHDRNPQHQFHKPRIQTCSFSTTSSQPFSPFSLSGEIAKSLLASTSSSKPSMTVSPLAVQATQTIPSPASLLFKTISDIGAYPSFLPFISRAVIDQRHPITNFPTRATLTVGYQGLTESFTSLVRCDPDTNMVEAWAGPTAIKEYYSEKTSVDSGTDTSTNNGDNTKADAAVTDNSPFEYLYTKWQLTELDGGTQTKADFVVKAQLKNALYNQLLRAAEGRVAERLIEGFLGQVRNSDKDQNQL